MSLDLPGVSWTLLTGWVLCPLEAVGREACVPVVTLIRHMNTNKPHRTQPAVLHLASGKAYFGLLTNNSSVFKLCDPKVIIIGVTVLLLIHSSDGWHAQRCNLGSHLGHEPWKGNSGKPSIPACPLSPYHLPPAEQVRWQVAGTRRRCCSMLGGFPYWLVRSTLPPLLEGPGSMGNRHQFVPVGSPMLPGKEALLCTEQLPFTGKLPDE